jgi:uncharacterized protein with von Willebrand factor type A (vWA) domain
MREILPLYHFFEILRENEFPLGIGEYENFLKALKHFTGLNFDGYNSFLGALRQGSSSNAEGIFPKEHLLRLAKLVWLKPNQSKQLFEDLFEETYFYDFLLSGKKRPGESNLPGETNATMNERSRTEDKSKKSENESEVSREDKGNTEYISQESDSENEVTSVRIAVSEHQTDNNLNLEQKKKPEIEKSKFLFTQNYFPIDKRKIQQNLKQYPTFHFSQYSDEADVPATISKAIEKGFFNEIVFKKYKVSTSHLLLLVDCKGSMIAFDPLVDTIGTALKNVLVSSKDQNFRTLYFSNIPSGKFYVDKTYSKAESLDKVLNRLENKSAGIIIISDAGAARGNYNINRIISTVAFLKKLHGNTKRIAWLNPMFEERWQNSSAGEISRYVAMFEATEKGVKGAVDFLKGRISKQISTA